LICYEMCNDPTCIRRPWHQRQLSRHWILLIYDPLGLLKDLAVSFCGLLSFYGHMLVVRDDVDATSTSNSSSTASTGSVKTTNASWSLSRTIRCT